MQIIDQGRQQFEVDVHPGKKDHVRLVASVDMTAQVHTLTPDTARALGEALITEANAISVPEYAGNHRFRPGGQDWRGHVSPERCAYPDCGAKESAPAHDGFGGQPKEKFSVGDLVTWNGPAPSLPVVISDVRAKRSEDGEIEVFFRAHGETWWRRLNNYRHATPEDKKTVEKAR